MKKLYLLSISICLCFCTACFPYLNIHTKVIDFSPYTAKGFYLTPAPTLEQKYQPLGEVAISLTNFLDGRRNISTEMSQEIERDIVVHNLARHFNIEKIEIGVYEYAICNLINKAMNLGGDGIVNLVIRESLGQNGLGELYISGFAIRRENYDN